MKNVINNKIIIVCAGQILPSEESNGQDSLLKHSFDDFDYHFIGTRTKSAAINPVSTTILNMFKILRA